MNLKNIAVTSTRILPQCQAHMVPHRSGCVQQATDLTIHNLSTYNLTPQDIQLLHKGLNFSLTPRTPPADAHRQILTTFNEFAKSLRLKYKRAQYPNQKQHHHTPKPTETSHLYRRMKFLPAPNLESPQQHYTGIAHLERYIDDTKQQIADNLPMQYMRQRHNTKPPPPTTTSPQQAQESPTDYCDQTITIKQSQSLNSN